MVTVGGPETEPTLRKALAIGADAGISAVDLGDADKASSLTRWLGFGAVVLASINIFGGFLVTRRMLAMFQ